MNQPPPYFRDIEQRTIRRWEQLDADPDLAAPWKQLFKQVKSPQHVISELLQNADDAGATSAWIDVSDGVFSFSHNGEDFTADQFASLCRFGYSNKRNLHTIGFRGIGFKSTFSVGDEVILLSPTVSVAFKANQFTRPHWRMRPATDGRTTVRIAIKETTVETALQGSMNQWVTSPVSILFFKNLEQICFNGIQVRKQDRGQGPTASSRHFAIEVDGEATQELLLIQSEEAEFPEAAIREIRDERNLDTEDFTMPPCRLEVVLGLSGKNRFFVVLPTGYEPDLPFSVNAPFIQDPARFRIKDPETSPTNQWLIQRTGELVATTFREWVTNQGLSLEERSKAYDLLPIDSRPSYYWSQDPYDYAEETIRYSFYSRIKDCAILSVDGAIYPAATGISISGSLHDVWESSVLKSLFTCGKQYLLSRFISSKAVRELGKRSWIKVFEDAASIEGFRNSGKLPRPESWSQLALLWEFIEQSAGRSNKLLKDLPIHPVKGSDTLAFGSQVIRTASRFERFSKADVSFLLGNVMQVDHEWIEWIAQRRKDDFPLDHADRILSLCGLNEPARPEFLAMQAANSLFAKERCQISDVVRLAHIFASIDAEIPESFYYACKDQVMRKPSDHLSLADQFGMDEQIPGDWFKEHCLHEDYFEPSETCSTDVWFGWAKSKKSRLWVGLPLIESVVTAHSKRDLEKLAKRHQGHEPAEYHYVRDDFEFLTYDFPEELRRAIGKLEDEEVKVWAAVLKALLVAPELLSPTAFKAAAYHQSGRGNKRYLDCGKLVPAWLGRFQGIACLPDTHGNLHVPSALMLRTPETEAVREIEKFVQADFDNHRTQPLLKALGVRSTPSDFQTVIDRIKTFQQIPNPASYLTRLQKLYEAVDRISLRCASDAMTRICDQFATQNLILTDAATWANSRIVCIHPDVEGVQREETVHSLIRHFGLWQRVGVSPTPSMERAIGWINDLPKGQKLPPEDVQRLRTYLKRDPGRIWESTGHWLSMDGLWSPVDTLRHRITMQSLVRTTDLFPDVLKACADLRTLTNEQLEFEAFACLRDLSGQVDLRATKVVEAAHPKADFRWVTCLGSFLARVILKDDTRRDRIRAAGARMASSRFIACNEIEVTPFLEAKPAGPSRKVKVAWDDDRILVENLKAIHLLDELEKELARVLDDPEMRDALKVCLDRDDDFIAEYLNTRFEFELITEQQPTTPSTSEEEPETSGSENGDEADPEDRDAKERPEETAGDDKSSDDESDHSDDLEDPEDKDERPTPDRHQDSGKPKADPRFETLKRHLKERGFVLSPGGDVFAHRDGSCVQKKSNPVHCWEETDAKGELTHRYWFAPKSIYEGVEMPAELWSLIHQSPAHYQIVEPLNGAEATLTLATDIVDGVNNRWVKVYPSRYLIRAEQN
jgi:hypothetical protein